MKQTHTGVWTIAEIEDGSINPVSYELLAWGKGLSERLKVELTSIVLTNKIKDIESLIHYGADKVYGLTPSYWRINKEILLFHKNGFGIKKIIIIRKVSTKFIRCHIIQRTMWS